MNDYTKKSLLDDGIREDSVFFEYVGHMRALTDLAEYILQKSTGRQSFEHRAIEILELVTDIHEVRFKHFSTLVEKNAVVDIFDTLSDGKRYTDAVAIIDKEIEDGLNELKFSLNNNRDIDAMRVFEQLKVKLQRLKGMDQHLYERSNARINRTFNSVSTPIAPRYQYSPNINTTYSNHAYNVDFTKTHPSQGIPIQSQSAVTPRPATQYYQAQQVENIPQTNYYTNSAPPPNTHTSPAMHQSGNNHTPVRNRKKKKITPKQLATFVLSTGVCVLGLAAFNHGIIGQPTQQTPSVPSHQPKIEQTGTMPSTTTSIPLTTKTTVAPTTEQIQIPVTTQAPVTTNDTHVKYDRNSLMYCLEYMDDEMVSVIAESLRNSVSNSNGIQLSMYGNGCNSEFPTDREYVAHVFGILDSRASSMKYGGNYDKFGIAPQMEQLSGDISKYLIAKAIGESGKYNKNNYSIDDVGFYYIIAYGETKDFDARTLKVKDGKLVEDELIGRTVHFKGDLRTLISSYCALNAAIDGGHMDKGTGRRTQCAYGTQEGDIIDSASLQAYRALINIFSNEHELVVTNRGKGVRIVYDKDMER